LALWIGKSFDGVPGGVTGWAVCGLGVGWWMVWAVMSAGVEAVVGMVFGGSGDFEVGVSVCQGSA